MPINAEYRGPADLPKVIPVFPLPGALLLPRGQMPLNIFEPRYLQMVDDAFRDGPRLIGMIQPDVTHSQSSERPILFKVGCVGRITQFGPTISVYRRPVDLVSAKTFADPPLNTVDFVKKGASFERDGVELREAA